MPRQDSVSEKEKDEEGAVHLIECNGPGLGKGCVAWVSTWLPKKLPKNFMKRKFLCGFCAAAEIEKLKEETVEQVKSVDEVKVKLANNVEQTKSGLASLFSSDAVEQYGRRDNIRIFGIKENADEDIYQEVINVAKCAGVNVTKSDISICHRVPSRATDKPRPVIVKFVRRELKHRVMSCKRKLKENADMIFINDDITPLRARLAYALRRREDINGVHFINEKLILYTKTNEKLVFENLFELHKWDSDFVMSICKDRLHFQ